MAGFRARGYSDSSGLLNSFKASNNLPSTLSVSSLKDRIGDLATSCSSVLSETKSSLETFIDDAKSAAHNSFTSILGLFRDDEVDIEQKDDISSISMETKFASGKALSKHRNRRISSSSSQYSRSNTEDSSSSLHEIVSSPTQLSFTGNESLSSTSSYERDTEAHVHHQLTPITGATNITKCTDWMTSIPEEVTPRSIRTSMSEIEITEWRANRENAYSFEQSGKKYFKAKSKSTENYSYCNRSCHAGPIFENGEQADQSDNDIRMAIIKVLNEFDQEKLNYIMRQTDIADNNANSCEDTSKVNMNIVPESEQYFRRSPHVKLRHAVRLDNTPRIQKDYINTKTDIFTKSAKASESDVHVFVGELHISLQFLITTERLKVTVEKICNLNRWSRKNDKCSIFVKATMVPEKKKYKAERTQAHRSDGTSHITYNHDMFFRNIKINNVHLLCLRFGVYRKSALFSTKQNKCIGECFVYLDEHDVVGKVNISERLISCE